MAPFYQQIAPTIPKAIHPSTWLFALTGSLLLGQSATALPFFLSAELLLLLLIPLLLVISPLSKLRRLGGLVVGRDLTSPSNASTIKYRGWALLTIVAGSMFALGYSRHHQLLFPTFPAQSPSLVHDGEQQFVFRGSAVA
jgi:hypothetical protein